MVNERASKWMKWMPRSEGRALTSFLFLNVSMILDDRLWRRMLYFSSSDNLSINFSYWGDEETRAGGEATTPTFPGRLLLSLWIQGHKVRSWPSSRGRVGHVYPVLLGLLPSDSPFELKYRGPTPRMDWCNLDAGFLAAKGIFTIFLRSLLKPACCCCILLNSLVSGLEMKAWVLWDLIRPIIKVIIIK